MGKNRNMIRIDGERLLEAVKGHGYHISQLSTDMGYNSSYLNNVIDRGAIAPVGANILDKIYGIPLSEYEYEEPLPWEDTELVPDDGLRDEPDQQTITVKLDEAQLELFMIDMQNIIRSAIYQEVKRAWSE